MRERGARRVEHCTAVSEKKLHSVKSNRFRYRIGTRDRFGELYLLDLAAQLNEAKHNPLRGRIQE